MALSTRAATLHEPRLLKLSFKVFEATLLRAHRDRLLGRNMLARAVVRLLPVLHSWGGSPPDPPVLTSLD